MPPRHSPRRREKAGAAFDTRERQQRERPSIVVVGFGRLGGSLAQSLQRARWPVQVFPRSGESVRRTVAYGMKVADQEAIASAAACILTVPDNTLTESTSLLVPDLGPHTALVHCAGALTLDAFGSDPDLINRPRGSFHPLVAISDPTDSLEGHAAVLAATTKPLLSLLRRMAQDLSMTALEAQEERRATYHAGAVLAAGGAVGLLSSAVEALRAAGVEGEEALSALISLMRSALSGVEARGLVRGLTGPLPRGDLLGVKRHLEALPKELVPVYRSLSRRGLALLGNRLPPETQKALWELLTPE